jgi:hypothetical protein
MSRGRGSTRSSDSTAGAMGDRRVSVVSGVLSDDSGCRRHAIVGVVVGGEEECTSGGSCCGVARVA